MAIKREPVVSVHLGMRCFHDSIYDGKELMEVVGIRKDSVELQGDYSGGTHKVCQKDWHPIEGLFRLRKACPQSIANGGDCGLPNVHCGYPNCSPYVESYNQENFS